MLHPAARAAAPRRSRRARGRTTGKVLALGYVRVDGVTANAACDVEVIGRLVPAHRLERPPVDPEGKRMRG